MALRKSLIIPGLLVAAALPAGWVMAQSGPPADMGPGRGPGMGPGMMEHGKGHHRWGGMRNVTPETRERLFEGRIAGAKAALKLNDEQLKLWGPVEQQMRANFAARQTFADERRKQREQRRANAPAQGPQDQATPAPQRPSMAERLERMSQRMSDRAERMKAFSSAFKPFYDALNDEQKAVAGLVLRDVNGRGRGHGHHHRRWAMDFGGSERGPGKGPGMGPGSRQ